MRDKPAVAAAGDTHILAVGDTPGKVRMGTGIPVEGTAAGMAAQAVQGMQLAELDTQLQCYMRVGVPPVGSSEGGMPSSPGEGNCPHLWWWLQWVLSKAGWYCGQCEALWR